MESSQWETWNTLFCLIVSFLTIPHFNFDMKQMQLYIYGFFKFSDQHSHHANWFFSEGKSSTLYIVYMRNLKLKDRTTLFELFPGKFLHDICFLWKVFTRAPCPLIRLWSFRNYDSTMYVAKLKANYC